MMTGSKDPAATAGLRNAARWTYLVLALTLMGGWFVQVFFVGMAIMVEASFWAHHVALGGWAAAPLAGMLAACWPGRLPIAATLTTVGLIAAFALLYGVFHFAFVSGVLIWRAFHPVLALAMFLATSWLAGVVWGLLRAPEPAR